MGIPYWPLLGSASSMTTRDCHRCWARSHLSTASLSSVYVESSFNVRFNWVFKAPPKHFNRIAILRLSSKLVPVLRTSSNPSSSFKSWPWRGWFIAKLGHEVTAVSNANPRLCVFGLNAKTNCRKASNPLLSLVPRTMDKLLFFINEASKAYNFVDRCRTSIEADCMSRGFVGSEFNCWISFWYPSSIALRYWHKVQYQSLKCRMSCSTVGWSKLSLIRRKQISENPFKLPEIPNCKSARVYGLVGKVTGEDPNQWSLDQASSSATMRKSRRSANTFLLGPQGLVNHKCHLAWSGHELNSLLDLCVSSLRSPCNHECNCQNFRGSNYRLFLIADSVSWSLIPFWWSLIPFWWSLIPFWWSLIRGRWFVVCWFNPLVADSEFFHRYR